MGYAVLTLFSKQTFCAACIANLGQCWKLTEQDKRFAKKLTHPAYLLTLSLPKAILTKPKKPLSPELSNET